MAKMIFVNEQVFINGSYGSELISINPDQILKIAKSKLNNISQSTITFSNDTTIHVIETIQDLTDFINN